ncbi:MAG: hypothetical protein AAFV49_21055, partial [Pseudomonadota bacterium]
ILAVLALGLIAPAALPGLGGAAGVTAEAAVVGAARIGRSGTRASVRSGLRRSSIRRGFRREGRRARRARKIYASPFLFGLPQRRNDIVIINQSAPGEAPRPSPPLLPVLPLATPRRLPAGAGAFGLGTEADSLYALALDGRGDTAEAVARSLQERRAALLAALERGGIGFCIARAGGVDIARSTEGAGAERGAFTGRLELRIRFDPGTDVLGTVGRLAGDTLAGLRRIEPGEAVERLAGPAESALRLKRPPARSAARCD